MNDTTREAQSKSIALFVSDVHLREGMPRTTDAFLGFLRLAAAGTQRLYILGDLFEYWAGDDDIDSAFNRHIVDAIRATSDAGVEVFWIAGNRDFLVGPQFATAAGLTALPDPSIVELAGHRIVLAHGDAQCTDDHGYMAFRKQVREPAWQQQFLGMPLAKRKEIIEGLRNGSKDAQRNKSYEIMDVNASAIASLFADASASVMIHGHTHRPGCHQYGESGNATRYVLPDWDCESEKVRGGWLALTARGEFVFQDIDGNDTPTFTRTAS